MNLIQVQEQLKSLPSGPQTMQALMSYANGANPQVPPYLALGELNRRKQLMERAQMESASQPPQGTVKDQVTQSAGLMALQQQKQQQAMQQLARGAMQQQTAVPGAVAQQGPVQAAGGGLLGRLMSYPAARYRSGGVISFAAAGDVDEEIRKQAGEQEALESYAEEETPEARRRRLEAEAMRFRANAPRAEDFDRIALRKRALEADPSLRAANVDPAEMLKRLDEMQAQRRAEIQRQREEATKARPGILQLLGQAAAGTRGQRGRSALASALAGYSELSQRQQEQGLAQEQGFRAKELELQQARMEAQNKLEEAQRARAEGRIEDYIKGMQEYQRIVKDYEVAKGSLLRGEIAATESRAAREEAARLRAEADKEKARVAAAKPGRVTDLQGDVNAEYAKIKADNPGMSDVDAMAQARKIARERQQQTQSRGVDVRAQEAAQRAQEAAQRSQEAAVKAANRAEMFNDPIFQRYLKGAGGDKATAKSAYMADYMAGKIAEPTAPGARPAAAKPSAAAPAAGQRKVGATQIVQSGPNKGKTAVWDGNGWKLQE